MSTAQLENNVIDTVQQHALIEARRRGGPLPNASALWGGGGATGGSTVDDEYSAFAAELGLPTSPAGAAPVARAAPVAAGVGTVPGNGQATAAQQTHDSYGRELCRDFLQGACNFASCKYSHGDQTLAPAPPTGHGGMVAAPYGMVPGTGPYMPMRAPYSQPMGYGPPMGAPYGQVQPMPVGAPYNHPMPLGAYGQPMHMGGAYVGSGMMLSNGAAPYGAMPMAGHAHIAPYPMQYGYPQQVVKPFFPGELPMLPT